MLKEARLRLGRRGSLLILGGLSWLGVGIQLLAEPRDRFSAPGDAQHALEVLDSPIFAYLWIIAGVITFFTGVFRDRRRVDNYDAIGFNTFLTPPLTWMLFFIWSFSVNVITDGREGSSFALYSIIVWGLVTALILVIAGWPEPYLKTVVPDNDKEG